MDEPAAKLGAACEAVPGGTEVRVDPLHWTSAAGP